MFQCLSQWWDGLILMGKCSARCCGAKQVLQFCRGSAHSKCFHILTLIQTKNKVQNFPGNQVLKNNVRLKVVSYCNNTWDIFYIAMLNLLDNTERILRCWVFHKQNNETISKSKWSLVALLKDIVSFSWWKFIASGFHVWQIGIFLKEKYSTGKF